MHDCGHPLLESAFQRHLRRVLGRRRIPFEWLLDAVGEVTIAEELNITQAAVRGRLKRMRKKFCDLVEASGLSHLRLPKEDPGD